MTARTFLRIAAVTSSTLLVCLALTTNSEATAPTIANLSPNFGTVGATVIIYGNNFGATKGSSTVKFNGTNVTSGTWSNAKITVIVPASATTGLVTVTTSGGSVSSAGDFNVLATNATLVLGAFAPQSSNCGLLPSGDDCITDYRSDVIPNVDGVALVTQWSSIESSDSAGTGSGGYVWSGMDNAVNTYFGQTNWTASKKVGIILSPITDGNVNTSTPAYVFSTGWATRAGASVALDECVCGGYTGDSGVPTTNGCWSQSNSTSTDISGMPAVWEKPFYVALQNFYSAAVTHLNSASYSSAIAYIRMGLSSGGEEYPHCSANLESLVTPSTPAELETVWTNYTNSMFIYESGLGSQLPLMAAPNGNGTASGVPSDAWADTEASDAVANGLNLGSEGLQFQDSIHVFTGLACSNDWCNTFSTDNPPIRELQTLQQSVPAENTCGSSTSAGGDYTDTGSLVCLLPFVEGKANSVELYPEDMFLAYDPNYSGNGTYGTAYSTAISNARAGH
jgi:hypothetical protein